MEKYLFLDIDGVLVNDYYNYRDEYGMLFAPECVKQLRNIIENTNAKIIISSTWKEYGIKFLNELWQERYMPGKIHDLTPSLTMTYYMDNKTKESFSLPETHSKGLEINAWLEMNASGYYNYCIIDDECFFLAQQLQHHIQTNSREGLTALDAEKVIQMLNSK